MMSVADVLTALGAGAGLAVLLIMAVVPLLVDRHRPAEREPPSAVEGECAGCGTVGGRA
jgi:hypothetical protein